MIAGAIVELTQNSSNTPWGLVCSGVGDCKIYHFSFPLGKSHHEALLSFKGKVHVQEVTVGSRNIENITDATDPGGRLGPGRDVSSVARSLLSFFRKEIPIYGTSIVGSNFSVREISS